MRNKLQSSLLICLTLLLLTSCTDENIAFEDFHPFKNSLWERSKRVSFEFEVLDTVRTTEISYQIRNNHQYPYSNLYLNYKILYSSFTVIKKNVQEMYLYNPKSGKPLGNTSLLNDTQDSELLFASHKFLKPGKYTINIQHQMRDNEGINGIDAIGILVKYK